MIVTVLTQKEKKVRSRAGMTQTTATSPLYSAWLETVEKDLEKVREGILGKRFTQLGVTAEMNALKMHATMHTTDPHIMYWEPETITLMKEVMALREEGTECYFTIDGGPQVKVLCLEGKARKIEKQLSRMDEVKKTYLCKCGGEAALTKEELF